MLERLRPVSLDGLVLYDIDDESDRNPEERPFRSNWNSSSLGMLQPRSSPGAAM
jgi:hypothetical protein